MANETLEYKVNLDTSDISNQLAQIKGQIDQTMAATTFRASVPDIQAQSFSFPTSQFAQSFSQIRADLDSGSRMAMEQARSFTETGRLGYQKFSQDMQNIALSVPISYPTLHGPGEAWAPDMGGWGPFKSFGASMGMGYDSHMAIGKGEYMRYADNKLQTNPLRDMAPGVGGLIGGIAGGAIGTVFGGPLGGAVGDFLGTKLGEGTAKLGYSAFAATVGQDFDAIQNMRGFLDASSWRSVGGEIGSRSAGMQAYSMTKAGRSSDMEGQRVGLKDVQEVMKSFTEAGGFDFARTAEDFSQKLKMVVGSVNDVAHAFKVSKDEATGIIAKFAQQGIGGETAIGMRTAVATMTAQALTFGYTPGEMMDFAMKSGESVRGTGIDIGSAITGGASTLAAVRSGMRQGAFDEKLVNQMGGEENIAATMGRAGHNWGLSTNGLTYFAAKDHYGSNFNGSMGAYDTMAGAVSQIGGSIGNFMQAKGEQAQRVSSMNADELYLNKSAQFITEASTAFGITGEKMNEAKYVAYAGMRGISAPEAHLQWDNTFNKSSTQGVMEARVTQNATEIKDRPGYLTVGIDQLTNAIAEDPLIRDINGAAELGNAILGEAGRGVKNFFTAGFNGYKTERVANYELLQQTRTKNGWRSWDEVKGVNTDKLQERTDTWTKKFGKAGSDVKSRDLGFADEEALATAARIDPEKVKKQLADRYFESMRGDVDLLALYDEKTLRSGAEEKADLYLGKLKSEGAGEKKTFEKVTKELGKSAATDTKYRADIIAIAKSKGVTLTLSGDAEKNAKELLDLQLTETGREILEAGNSIGPERVKSVDKAKMSKFAANYWNEGIKTAQEGLKSDNLFDKASGLAKGLGSMAIGASARFLADHTATARTEQKPEELARALEQDKLRVDLLRRNGMNIELEEGKQLSAGDRSLANDLDKKDYGHATVIELSNLRRALTTDGIKIKN